MAAVDPARLPYPWPEGAAPKAHMGPNNIIVQMPGALAVGSALGYRGASDSGWRPIEGALAAYSDHFAFFIGDGTWGRALWDLDYEGLAKFKLQRSRLPGSGGVGVKKLSLFGKGGSKHFFRIGPEMAANVNYILTVKEVPSR